MKYHVYIQGYGEDDVVNDYDEPVAAFEDEEQAVWFATHFPFKANERACSRTGTLVWIIETSPPWMPVTWHMQSRIVILFARFWNSGRYLATGSSIRRMPRSTATMIAQPVNVFVIEKIAKTVSGRIGTRFSASAQPKQSHVSR